MATSGSILGNPVLRTEDPRILRGEAGYFDDLEVEGLLHVAFVRSTMAHARIESVDTSEAVTMPGVVAVYTADDLGLEPGQGFAMVPAALSRPPLARDVVRFVGDIVAVIVAETRAQAVDAAEMVIVDYDPLPTVIDPEAALADDAPLVFPEHGSNLAIEFNFGDDPSIFDDADVVVEGRFLNQRLAPVPMEPNGILVELDGDDGLTAHVPTQNPHGVRDPLAGVVGLDEERVRVVATTVGGGFGAKAGMYPEFAIAATAARKLGRPVKWSETRSENMTAMTHGRGQIQYIELGLKRDGIFTGLRGRIVCDGGAYPGIGAFLPYLTRTMSQGVYRIPRIQVNSKSAITNTTPTAAYRGAGRPEATYNIERIMGVAAHELGMDPAEFRLKNFPQPKEFPFTTVTGLVYDSAKYQESIKRALELSGYDSLRRRQKNGWKNGKYYGVGVSTYVEICAIGPSAATPAGGWESGTVRIEPTGKVTVLTGASPHGQGQETTFAQLIADELGIDPEDVNVIHGDTLAVPYGIGTFGSRATAVGGTAAYLATQKLKTKMVTLAAHLLGTKPPDITFGRGRLSAKGGKKSISFGELVMAAYTARNIPRGFEPGLEATHFFEPSNFTFPFGAHIASVEVDPETGEVKVDKYVAVDDCGNVINPMLVDGQIHGGIAQGMGQAMWEELIYNDEGQIVNGTLMDYALPKAHLLPDFTLDRTVTPTPVNPMGVKGVGEAGTIASTPCMVNAVCDALSPLGIKHIDMPLKPERVWSAMQQAQAAAKLEPQSAHKPLSSRASRGNSVSRKVARSNT